MKQLFILGSFLTIILFLFGCQSEAPVSPLQTYESDILDKPGPIQVASEVVGDKVNVTWNRVGGAKSYEVQYFYQSLTTTNHYDIATITTSDLACSFNYDATAPNLSEDFFQEIMVIAKNGKDAAIKSGGTVVPAVIDIDCAFPASAVNVSWDAFPGATYYRVYLIDASDPSNELYIDFYGTYDLSQVFSLSSSSITAVKIRVDAYDYSNGNVIATGTAYFNVPE